MKSAWWWGSEHWQRYLAEYAKTRPDCLNEWKSSPLANDHDFSEYVDEPASAWERKGCFSQVLDLRTHQWSDVRKSYHSIIHRAQERYEIGEDNKLSVYRMIHHLAFGNVRNEQTFICQQDWLRDGYAMVVNAMSRKGEELCASSLWIIYQGKAFYASGPSLEKNVQHAVIWKSLQILKARGVTLVELGQIDGGTEKEKNIGKFKAGWGGEVRPFTIVRRKV